MTTCDIAIIIGCVMLLLICFCIDFSIDSYYKHKTDEAENKLIDIDRLRVLRNTNEDEFIKEAEFILKYLKNKRYSEFYEFCYSRSKHNKGYYIVGYTNITNSKRCFPCHNIMGNYGYPDYYLKDMNEVKTYYIDLLWRELSNMNKEKKRFDEYDERREF